jgi:hypothetical protein
MGEQLRIAEACDAADRRWRRRAFPYTEAVTGNAACKIVRGDVRREELDEAIARCHWCNTVTAGSYTGKPSCWHLAARVLFDLGLRSAEAPDA